MASSYFLKNQFLVVSQRVIIAKDFTNATIVCLKEMEAKLKFHSHCCFSAKESFYLKILFNLEEKHHWFLYYH